MDERTIARFNAKVDRSGGPDACHPWTGKPGRKGYGRIGHILAHRLAFFLAHGRWPEPCGLHSCDNPPCCNARHIFEGTQAQNIADKLAKGRQAKGNRIATARLNPARVRRVLRLRSKGLTLRAIGGLLDVSHVCVLKVVSGKRWRHVTGL